MKGRIVDFYTAKSQMAVQGIRGGRGYSNEPILGGYYNGAGAFCSYPVSHLYMKVVLYTPNGNRIESIDIRDYVKGQTGGRRITQNYVQQLKENNCGKKTYFSGSYAYGYDLDDYSILDL